MNVACHYLYISNSTLRAGLCFSSLLSYFVTFTCITALCNDTVLHFFYTTIISVNGSVPPTQTFLLSIFTTRNCCKRLLLLFIRQLQQMYLQLECWYQYVNVPCKENQTLMFSVTDAIYFYLKTWSNVFHVPIPNIIYTIDPLMSFYKVEIRRTWTLASIIIFLTAGLLA